MEIIKVNHLFWNDIDHKILCGEVHLTEIGVVPIAIHENYDVEYGRILWENALKGVYGKIQEYEPPTKEELRTQLPIKSMVEFRAALRAIKTENIPDGIYAQDVNNMIDSIADLSLQEEARDYFNLSQYIERMNPWVDILGGMFGLSPEEIDELWSK